MKKLKYIDYYIFIPYIILSVIGILMVYSASSFVAVELQGKSATRYLILQSAFVFVGFFITMFVLMFKYKMLKNKQLMMAAVVVIIVMLIYLFLFGEKVNGAAGWLQVGSFGIQPAEFAKIVIIWYFAFIFSKKQKGIVHEFRQTITPPSIIFLVFLLLIVIQPDVGGAGILLVIGVVMIFASGISATLGIGLGVTGVGLILGVVELVKIYGTKIPFLEQYQYNRFLAFWNPFALSNNEGNQLVNSYFALRRGGIFGVGIGKSVQKTGYLPEPYTDFIMSILGEETGLIGILVVVSLFFFLILRIYLIGIRAKDAFGSLLCIGIATMLLVQGFINLGGVLGLLPISGVTFPFISYGGSSTLILTISIGLVLNVSATERIRAEEQLLESRKLENN
ncbi:FtsW/RodA/SpoVE family cell cycle protein [Carnobacterium gallinarum]|uniref:FtsW/RodA/SpoVE family cell cycle protein n=1 Tax=Carnobacterium gallinarum TaxID=2749 RepID=UPI00054D1B16|nr:FtsW/RodA/SpoVE family cell cycle protein [Carnobacterium gallinarum]